MIWTFDPFLHSSGHPVKWTATHVCPFLSCNPYLRGTWVTVVGSGIYSTWFLYVFFLLKLVSPVDAAASNTWHRDKPAMCRYATPRVKSNLKMMVTLLWVECDRIMIYPLGQNVSRISNLSHRLVYILREFCTVFLLLESLFRRCCCLTTWV